MTEAKRRSLAATLGLAAAAGAVASEQASL
ncbi:MAG: hypothetical protein JWN04_4182, partial [Myxococcaceae bacterium]|nr:hypothetical protein [Myxococcaceae bacterium]